MNGILGRRDLLKMGPGAAAAAAMSAQAASRAGARGGSPVYFDVRSYGTSGDGKHIDSPAINAAIQSAAAAGGGTVYLPAGQYLSYSLRLASKVHLYLDQAATLIAAPSPERGASAVTGYYDAAEANTEAGQYQDFGHSHWRNSLIWGDGLHDVSIAGQGLIWGRGLTDGARANEPGVGNKSLALKNCRNVLLRDLSILAGGHFAILMTGVDNLTIDNLKIDTNRDGMDLDCCRNVRVSNCTVNSPWDDGICVKSSYALGTPRSADNITISNCYVTGVFRLGTVLDGSYQKFAARDRAWRTGRIKCGTESNGGFRNITISNCVFEGCQGLALETVDGATLEDIAITNVTMRDIVTAPIFLRLGARLRGPEGTKPGVLRRVLIQNLVSSSTAEKITTTRVGSATEAVYTPWTVPYQLSSIIGGIPLHPVEDVKLSDIYALSQGGAGPDAAMVQPPENEGGYPEPTMFGPTPAHGLFIRHARNVEVSHVEFATVQSDSRAAVVIDDVHQVDFVALKTPHAEGRATLSVRSGSDLRISISRGLPDTNLPGNIHEKEF